MCTLKGFDSSRDCGVLSLLPYSFKRVSVIDPEEDLSMQTAVTEFGEIAIPDAIQKRFSLRAGDSVEWFDDGNAIRLVPVHRDAIAALKGRGRGEGLTQRLLASRREEMLHG
jgi:bifunctional DNA-binding transcriptional regulator/antitoxin component of YhaV-PrlF toxin-antitoxin module